MSFLAPLFLLGGLAVALPVIFHLIRRTTREKTLFSSLMFLLPTPPRLTRRSRLEDILLLVLRCLVLCLLALGFARPFLKKAVGSDPSATADRRLVLLVDTSASMRRSTLWADARARVESILRKTVPSDQVAIFAFDRQAHALLSFEQWNATPAGERVALALRRLADHPPGWAATHLGNALISAAEALTDTAGKPATARRQIVLVSDLQEGSRLDQLQGYEWPKGLELSVEPLQAKRPSNAGLQLATEADDNDRKPNAGVRVRVQNAANAKREQFKVTWMQPDGRAGTVPPVEVYVPAGQSRVAVMPLPPVGSPADRLVLQGDDEDFDNTVFVVPPEPTQLEVLYLGRESEKDARQPLYFLQRAFQETRRQTVRLLARGSGAPLPADEVQTAALLVVTEALPEAQAQALHDQIAAGKSLLFALRNEAAAPTLARLLGRDRIVVEEARLTRYAMLTEIDFRHPLFAPFADPRFSDFTKIHFWKYRRLEAAGLAGARVVAKFDNGDPALLEFPVGKGRVLVLTSCWHPDDSQFALSTKFVPFIYSLLEYGGAANPLPAQFHVGDVVPLGAFAVPGQTALTLRAPDGSQPTLAAGETNFSQTVTPGIYTVTSAQPPRRLVVNLDAAESRTAPLALDELERLGVPIFHPAPALAHPADHKALLQNVELESRQKLWRWLILLTLGVLLLETWLAGRAMRRTGSQPS